MTVRQSDHWDVPDDEPETCHGCERPPTDLDGRCDRCACARDPWLWGLVDAMLSQDAAESVRVVPGGLKVDGLEMSWLDIGGEIADLRDAL